ncbi:hypothetical protein HBH56_213640 [Parastagonospora nodorum]|nr:hypothetical protein HBH56_213640 [Parastagonospora nodorum]KAH3923117.1 hypothetical protein HBH54_215310 [Parastagonospora nodorum]KAH3966778.1 hypothetical protein HBH52_195380 [Parastagonospora nodorum]KAH4081842.1 hypothetical protein HBH48_194080 [Parastagonospora nodorum]KAH4092667.1 hypothetical protein HBH46_181730 [Parastagonospora nodorum]
MSLLLRIGQILQAKESLFRETVVVKSVEDHPRVENERDVLRKLQHRTPFLRPMIDEVEDPSLPATIVLKYLESDLLVETVRAILNRKQIKYTCRRVLEALKVIHEDNFVHTDVKLDNVFVKLQRDDDNRFSDVQLGDFGGCYPVDSEWATAGTRVGTPMWSSPEVLMEMPWNTAADIWSFGTLLISLIYGGDFNLFRPKLDRDHEEYLAEVMMQQFRYFGPFPAKIADIASEKTVQSILWLMQAIPQEKLTSFSRTTEREVCKRDKDFIGRIMMLDWRDRPTAKELLEDEWWNDD